MDATLSKRVLLLSVATSYRVAAYQRAATALGLETLIACDGNHALASELYEGISVDLQSVDDTKTRLCREHQARPFCAVVAVDDATVELASVVAEALGLPHNPVTAAKRTTRKDLARQCLAEAGLETLKFKRLDLRIPIEQQLDGIEFPCVIKPLAMSGSRGVMRADSPEELARRCERAARIVAHARHADERTHLLVESFLPGGEVALEGLLHDGELEVLAIFDKPDPLDGPYFEETYYITPSRLPGAVQQQVISCVANAATAFGLVRGPVHAEVRVDGSGARLIELAARTIGGDCARLMEFGTGHTLESLVLSNASGLSIERHAASGAAGVLMLPTQHAGTLRRVEGVLDALKVDGVEDVVITVREGYELVPLPEGNSYLGFVFATAGDPADVERALREAHRRLNVVVAPSWKIEPVNGSGA